MSILLGYDRNTHKPVYVPHSALKRHLHLIGYTGSGKTTAIVTLLTGLLKVPIRPKCMIIIDRLGGFSADLLHWFSSDFCLAEVRERLLYVEAAREDAILGMNPLLYDTPGEGYYRTARAAEIVLRGWANQNIQEMPRLARWLFNSFWAVAQLGLTIADCAHLVLPWSDFHGPILNCLPDALRGEWAEIIDPKGAAKGQAVVQLESTRNRLKPFWDCPSLHGMFSTATNFFDVNRWMQEKKVVLINLAPMGRVPDTMADAIGGLAVNEVFAVARSLPPEKREEILLVLDEFQNFIGPDLQLGIAECRQLKIELVLSHQSFSQLKNDHVDLTSLILQAQSRLMLNVQGLDAELLATELAALTWDSKKLKEEIWHECQRVSGHRIIELQSQSTAEQLARQWGEKFSFQDGKNRTRGPDGKPISDGDSRGYQRGTQEGSSEGRTHTAGTHQSVLPEYEKFMQLASRTYFTFDEQKNDWGKALRSLHTGEAVWRAVNDNHLHEIAVKRTAPGLLALPWEIVLKQLPQQADAYYRLLENNFQQNCFQSPAQIDRKRIERLERVLRPKIVLQSEPAQPPPPLGSFGD